MGFALGSGLALSLWAKGRTRGTAHSYFSGHRRGIATPHIRRRSRALNYPP